MLLAYPLGDNGAYVMCGIKVVAGTDMSVWRCCTMRAEGVQWILLRNPIYIYAEDAAALRALMGANFRPVQPLNGRLVSSTTA